MTINEEEIPERMSKRQYLDHTGQLIRKYSADGSLYAYRDGDEHVVVSRGREPRDKWEKRVPATRTADDIEEGQKLWTIPSNWEKIYHIDGNADYAQWDVYRIPEDDVDVRVSVPSHNWLIDAWYGIRDIGEAEAVFAGDIDREDGVKVLERVENHADEYDDLVVDALWELVTNTDRWKTMEENFRESIRIFAPDAMYDTHDVPRVASSGTDIWRDHFPIEDDVREAIRDYLKEVAPDLDGRERRDVYRGVQDLLQPDAVPYYPRVTVEVE